MSTEYEYPGPACHKHVQDTYNVQKKCHKQVINNKFSETVFRTFYNTLFMSIKRLKKIPFFSIPSSHCIVSSSMYELLIINTSLLQ